MATDKQRAAARRNVKKAQAGAKDKRTISHLTAETRSALARATPAIPSLMNLTQT